MQYLHFSINTRVFYWLQSAGFFEANQLVRRLVSHSVLLQFRTRLKRLRETGNPELSSSQVLPSLKWTACNLVVEGTLRTARAASGKLILAASSTYPCHLQRTGTTVRICASFLLCIFNCQSKIEK